MRPEEGRAAWGGFVWALPMLFIFWDPYRSGAGWLEWTLTGLAFAVFLVLYALGLASSLRPGIMARLAVAMAALAIVFTAYRPSGAMFFVLAAAYGPFAVGGSVPKSLVIIASTLATMALEYGLLWPVGYGLPYIVAVNTVLVGLGTTFVARQMIALRRAHRATERERIARDLHDILGHTLSVVILRSELAGRLVDDDPARAREEMEAIELISRDALAEVRDAITGYRSGDLTSEAERARSALVAAGVEAEVRVDGVDMSPALERVFGLALREAVTNVLRHAGARRCQVSFRTERGSHRLEVRDDGRGGDHVEGMGMAGIRERVEALGGSAEWTMDVGTVLAVSIPATS